MIPYFSPGPWSIGPFTIHAFGILVGLAIIFGVTMTQRDADKRGLSQTIISEAQIWALVVGFVMAHWVSVIFYFPERIREDPLELLWIWKGISSFGGFLGGMGGLIFYFKLKKVDVWPHIDTFGWGFAWAWILGRFGCTMAHDHPGKVTDFAFSVQYPAYAGAIPGVSQPTSDVAQTALFNKTLPLVQRFDLGFYEMIFAIVLVTILVIFNRKANRFPGFNVTMLALVYAPVRFFFDYLRIVDNKIFLGMTAGQFGAIALFGLGIWMLVTRLKATKVAEEAGGDAALGHGDKGADEAKTKTKTKAKTKAKTVAKKRTRKKSRKHR
jgi:phosphatidylglycerol:prolipoprotein diacylglycerol transferase